MKTTKDPVNQELIEHEEKFGPEKIGVMNSKVWSEDPKRFVFTLSRYKFVSKLLAGREEVLEIGCGDGFCSHLVQSTVKNLTISDYDPLFIEKYIETNPRSLVRAIVHDILAGPFLKKYHAIYALDVLDHIHKKDEEHFLNNTIDSLDENGVLILGMPSLESQIYASKASKEGHVNCKNGEEFKLLMESYFHNVFLFSMNDEVVHTGFEKMAHYIFTISSGKKLA